MRNDLPPVKETTSGSQLKVYIILPNGTKTYLLASDEVSNKYHVVVPATEFWITEEELEDAKAKMKEAQEKKRCGRI